MSPKPIKALTVQFEPIQQSMRDLCRESSDYFFHKPTGKVVSLSRRVILFLTQDGAEDKPIELPDWEAKMIPVARQIILDGLTDYVRIPEAFGQWDHIWMKEFSTRIRSSKLRQKINEALHGRGACRRFKEILKDFPEESRQWSQFRSRHWAEKIQAWFEDLGILAIEDTPKKVRTSNG